MEKQEIVKREVNKIAILNDWIERYELLLGAKEQFEIIDYQLKKQLKPIFEEYNITRFDDEDLQIILKRAYEKKSWNNEKVEELISNLGEIVDDYKNITIVKSTMSIKYKGK